MRQGIVRGYGFAARRIAAIGRRPDFWLTGLLLWALISAERSSGTPWAQAALTEALRWCAGIGLAVSLGWFLRPTALAGQFLITVAGGMALFGILGGDNAAHSGLVGPYHDHQLYGSVLLLLLPFAAWAAQSAKEPSWRWGASAVLAAGTLCLILSQTRSAWAGLAAAALVFAWLWLSRRTHRPLRWRLLLVPAILLLVGVISLWLLNGPSDQQTALTTRAATLTALSRDGSWQGRLELWRGTARMIAAHPLTGVGLGRYPGEMWHWTRSGGPLAPTAHPSLSTEAHSFYGQTTAEMGLIGLGLYLAALLAFTVTSLRLLQASRHRRLSEQNALLIAVLSALAGQVVDAVASPSWQFSEVSFFFWAVVGLGLAILRRKAEHSAPARVAPAFKRAWQLALSGTLAVVFAAQLLPLGLLPPVEAYTAPSAWTLSTVVVSLTSPATPVVGGSTLQFKLIANYKDASGVTHAQDVTSDPGATYGGQVNGPSKSYLAASFTNGAMTLSGTPTYSANSTLTVTVYYHDTVAAKAMYSNALVVPIKASS